MPSYRGNAGFCRRNNLHSSTATFSLMNSPAATTFLLFITEFLLSCLNLLSHTYLPTYTWLILESGLPQGFYLLPPSSTQTAFSKVTSVLLTAGLNVLFSSLLLVAWAALTTSFFALAFHDNAPSYFPTIYESAYSLSLFAFSPFWLLIIEKSPRFVFISLLLTVHFSLNITQPCPVASVLCEWFSDAFSVNSIIPNKSVICSLFILHKTKEHVLIIYILSILYI